MYVWEEGLRETTWEQNCFKFSLENRERRQLSGVLWKLIPCRWTRMWKRPFSEFRPKSRLDVTRRVGGAQTKWTWWSICRLQHVERGTKGSDRCVHCTMSHVIDVQFADLAINGLRDNLLLFVHDQTDPNVLQLLTSASQLRDGVLVEVVLSGN